MTRTPNTQLALVAGLCFTGACASNPDLDAMPGGASTPAGTTAGGTGQPAESSTPAVPDMGGASSGPDAMGDASVSNPPSETVRVLNDVRFEIAEDQNAGWCLRAQTILARLEGSELLTDQQIGTVEHSDQPAFAASKAIIDPASTPPLELQTLLVRREHVQLADGTPLSRDMYCKSRSKDRIEGTLGVATPGAGGSCREVNMAALDWALGQLTDEERVRYEQRGARLMFRADVDSLTGSDWLSTPSAFTADPDERPYTYVLKASALPVVALPVVFGYGPDDIVGVHYCKLWTPAQMLYWLLEQAYQADPLDMD